MMLPRPSQSAEKESWQLQGKKAEISPFFRNDSRPCAVRSTAEYGLLT
jgi:hypothetical protein